MEDEGWRMEILKMEILKMEGEGWRVVDGGWKMEDGGVHTRVSGLVLPAEACSFLKLS